MKNEINSEYKKCWRIYKYHSAYRNYYVYIVNYLQG